MMNLLNSCRLANMDLMTMTKMIDEASCDESVKKVSLKKGIIQLKNEVTNLERRVTDQDDIIEGLV